MSRIEKSFGICPETGQECLYRRNLRECPHFDKEDCNFAFFSGSQNPELAQEIIENLMGTFKGVSAGKFDDGEPKVKLDEMLRGRRVVLFNSGQPDPNRAMMEMILMIDAAKRGSASEITAMFSFFPLSRQDRKPEPHVPISSAAAFNALKGAGANRVVAVDIHSEQQQGFFDGPVDIVYSSNPLLPRLQEFDKKKLVVVSTDAGGFPRAKKYRDYLNAPGLAAVIKQRDDGDGSPKAFGLVGDDVEGMDVIVPDDIIATAKSLVEAAKAIKARGARSVTAVAPHLALCKDAFENLNDPAIDLVIGTNTIMQTIKHPKIETISVGPLMADVVRRIINYESLSELIPNNKH